MSFVLLLLILHRCAMYFRPSTFYSYFLDQVSKSNQVLGVRLLLCSTCIALHEPETIRLVTPRQRRGACIWPIKEPSREQRTHCDAQHLTRYETRALASKRSRIRDAPYKRPLAGMDENRLTSGESSEFTSEIITILFPFEFYYFIEISGTVVVHEFNFGPRLPEFFDMIVNLHQIMLGAKTKTRQVKGRRLSNVPGVLQRPCRGSGSV